MKLFIILLLLLNSVSIFAQDGSNIKYVRPENINNTLIGKTCHIDFGSESFKTLIVDTLKIEVKGQKIKFVEHRMDNGFNNSFREQYLIALPLQKISSTRLIATEIDSLDSEKIYVTSILGYYHNESPLDSITIINHHYLRENVAAVLVEN